MNLPTIIIGIIVAAVIVLAAIGTWKNKGKCSGCSGDCAHCKKDTWGRS